MPTVASGVIVPHPGTAATVAALSGWTRKTALDGKYIVGASTGADAGTTGGQATHDHASPAGAPTQVAHNHPITVGNSSGTTGVLSGGLGVYAAAAHSHTGFNSASATGTNQSASITVNANTSNDLTYVDVIFIESDGTPVGVPNGALAFFDSDTLPSGWTRVQGNRYLRGAAAAGDGGGTGGSNTHGHTCAAITYLQNSVAHAAVTSTEATTTVEADDDSPATQVAAEGHTHQASILATTPTNQSVTPTMQDANHEPEYVKLNIIRNDTGGDSLPTNLIEIWSGTHAGIPANWERVTVVDTKFPKGANADGEVLTTGGSTSHPHTANAFTVVQNSHTGTAGSGAGGFGVATAGAGVAPASRTHTHVWTAGATTAVNNSYTPTISSNTANTAKPPYVEVIFIKYVPPLSTVWIKGGNILGAVIK
jgi:hypothetical protein